MALGELGGKGTVDEIQAAGGLAHSAVMRATLELQDKKLVKATAQKRTIVTLTDEGKTCATEDLPERRLMKSVAKLGGSAKIDKAVQDARLTGRLVAIALGWMRTKGWAKVQKGSHILALSAQPSRGPDEELLTVLRSKPQLVLEELYREKRDAAVALRRRKLLKMEERTVRTLHLTNKGRRLVEKGVDAAEEVSRLTPELIVTGKWREAKLRRFKVEAPSPPRYPGKIHPLQLTVEKAREIFLEMGFSEIRGPLVETAFWNFDALFTPQDHPAREMMDTFYVSRPRSGRLPERSVVRAVARTHENGWTTGSTGWGYKWSPKEAKRLVLRTHTTAETIKYLSEHKKPPIKVFSVDRVYRNEQLTYKHTAEFYQIEGIVVDKMATLRDLMGTLKEFYRRFGLKRVQFWPCYFPYTEPSAQAMVYVPQLKHWMELCGMGIFRPEVLAPVKIKHPVLAWGGGLERIAMLELGVTDIRELYRNDLRWIRGMPICL